MSPVLPVSDQVRRGLQGEIATLPDAVVAPAAPSRHADPLDAFDAALVQARTMTPPITALTLTQLVYAQADRCAHTTDRDEVRRLWRERTRDAERMWPRLPAGRRARRALGALVDELGGAF